MRTTIDLPDALFRKTKAQAAMQGTSMRELIVRALERETGKDEAAKPERKPLILPHIRLKHSKKLDLTRFDFDDLLG